MYKLDESLFNSTVQYKEHNAFDITKSILEKYFLV